MGDSAATIATMLMAEHDGGQKFHPFAAASGIADLAGAYAVQREFVRLQMEAREVRPVGYKVGLTSPRMQAMCKIDRPVAGVILNDRQHRSGMTLVASQYGRPGLEFELAVRMGRDLRYGGKEITLDEVAAAVDAVAPAMEIVDDRHCDYATMDVLSLIADNSWNAGMVLGEFRRPWPDLVALEGEVSLDGAVVDRGHGRDVLGHPFRSVAWLIQHLGEMGERLRAGDIVMTGNWVTTKFPATACAYRFDLRDLGGVELAIRA